jgi:glycosyltransferase involved in cell wall biosynthesis
MVHTINDVNRLKALGLVENVTMIPQGALTMDEPATVPVVAKNEGSIVIGCYGFFVKDKGIMQLIEAVAQLRDHYGELRLRLVNAQYDETESAREIARCRTVAETAGLDAVVEWHTDFLPDVESRRLLADCDLVVLPYQVSKEGSSAALRMAMSAGSPVAVTPLPLFDEAGAAAFRFASPDSAAIAQGIAFLLDRPKQRQAMQAEMRLWMADRAWPVIAERFQGMLRGLRVNWRMPHAGCPSVGAGTLPTVLAPVDTTV